MAEKNGRASDVRVELVVVSAMVLAVCVGLGASVMSRAQTTKPLGSGGPMLTEAVQMLGIRQCLPAIDATARRVTQGATRHDILIDWYRASPNTGPVFSMIGMEFGTDSVIFNLAAVPVGQGKCTLFAERISATQRTCEIVASSDLHGYSATPLLPTITVYSSPKRPAETISLVKLHLGCLVIRRQATFDWGE